MTCHERATAGFRWPRILLAAAMAGAVFGSPVPKTTYDQTQQGELNVRADLDNILVLFVPSGGVRLVDNQQIGNILQLFSNSRKNFQNEGAAASAGGGGHDDSPYKVDVQQSAIDRLQSEIDGLNTVIPITKSYGLQKKEEDDRPGETVPIAEPTSAETEDATRPDSSAEKLSTRKPETSKSDATTVESIVTGQPVTQVAADNEHKDDVRVKTSAKSSVQKEEKPIPALTGPPHKAHHKTAAQKPSHHNAKPADPRPAAAKRADAEDDPLTKRLRSIQSGITHCSPGEALTENGDCVKIPEKVTEGERRQEKMDRLLELLRFGLQPADGSR